MTNPTPTPDLAAMIAHVRKWLVLLDDEHPGQRWQQRWTKAEWLEILDAAESGLAASRPAPPVADGEVARICDRIESKERDFLFRNDQRGATLMLDARSLLLSLSSRLSATEARAEQAEARVREEIALKRDALDKLANERERTDWAASRADAEAAQSAALRERVGALEVACRLALNQAESMAKHMVPTTLRAALSAAPAVPQPAPATAMPRRCACDSYGPCALHEDPDMLDFNRPAAPADTTRMADAAIAAREDEEACGIETGAPAPAGKGEGE